MYCTAWVALLELDVVHRKFSLGCTLLGAHRLLVYSARGLVSGSTCHVMCVLQLQKACEYVQPPCCSGVHEVLEPSWMARPNASLEQWECGMATSQ
jgi:hypothetical protein